MVDFFKLLGKGFLFLICLPFILIFACILLVLAIPYYIVYGIYLLIRRIATGRPLLETEYDRTADKILHPEKYVDDIIGNNQTNNTQPNETIQLPPQQSTQPQYTTVNNYYTNPQHVPPMGQQPVYNNYYLNNFPNGINPQQQIQDSNMYQQPMYDQFGNLINNQNNFQQIPQFDPNINPYPIQDSYTQSNTNPTYFPNSQNNFNNNGGNSN